MGNRRIVKELKDILNFKTWGVLVHKPRLDKRISSLCCTVIKYGQIVETGSMHYSTYIYRNSFFLGYVKLWRALISQRKINVNTMHFSNLSNSSVRKQPTLEDATIGFPAKWRLRNELRNSILMTRHYLYCLAENLLQAIRSTTHIWVVTRHRYGNFAPVSQTSFRGENSGGVAKFRLFSQAIQTAHKTALHNERTKYPYRQNAKPRKWNVTHHFSLHVTDQVLFSAICVGAKCHPSTRGRSRKIVLLLIFKLPAEKHVLFGKLKWHAHGWADDAITRQNLIKIMAY